MRPNAPSRLSMANARIGGEARKSDVKEGPEKLLPSYEYRQDKFLSNLWINCGP
ncbi:hypothetical protein RHECNPAF_930070 [Rhizobium etli CNPAF512]|nr:hypothetical protein RHECNPAF_930070 [Rhizobium etli CNPAF512]